MATENVSSSVKPARVAQRTASQMPTSVPTAVKNPCQVICSGRLSRGTSHLKRVGSMLIGMGQSSSARDNSIVGLFDWLKRTPPKPVTWHVYREAGDVVADD